jgi:hypothetical protein
LTSQAGKVVLSHVDRAAGVHSSPSRQLARMAVQAWSVGHHLWLLLAVVRRTPGSGLFEALAPLNDAFEEVIRQGQQRGEFSTHLPAGVLAKVLGAQAMALHEAFDDKTCCGTAEDAAVATLVTVGVRASDVRREVDSLDSARPKF